MHSCTTGVLHGHPLRHAPLQPNAASPSPPAQRPAAPSAAQWKFPSGASAGASGARRTSPGPSQELGCCHLSAALPPQPTQGRIIWSREAGGSRAGAALAPSPLPALASLPASAPAWLLFFFQAPLPSFKWALPAQPRNLPLSGTADERRDKFRKKSLCGSEEKHGGPGNPSCSEEL